MKPTHVIGFLAAIGLTFGQTLVDLKTQTKNVDFSRALQYVRSLPVPAFLPSAAQAMFFIPTQVPAPTFTVAWLPTPGRSKAPTLKDPDPPASLP